MTSARVFILLTVFLDATGVGIIFPVMPDLLEEVTQSGLSAAALWGGILATGYAAMQFLFGPVVGNLSDALGRRPVMLVALAVMALDYTVLALAASIWLLLAGRLIAGISAATHATASAYMADISAPADKARNFGLIGAAFGLGFVLGPVLGGLAAQWGTRAPFWLAAALAGGNLVFGWIVLPETVTEAIRRPFRWARANPLAAFRAIGHLPGLRRYLLGFTVFQLAMFVYPAIWSFYGKARFGWDPTMIGLSLAAFGLAMAAVNALLVGPVIGRIGAVRALRLSFVMEAAICVFFGLVSAGWLALVFTPIAALAGFGGPALQQILSNAVPDDQQGELQGVLGALMALATGIAPLVMTGVFALFTRPGAAIFAPGAPFLLSAMLMILALALLPSRAAE